MLHVIVDGANVVGARPDGWWRDRPAAASRLATGLVSALSTDPAALAEGLGRPSDAVLPDGGLRVHLVLEGAATRAADLPTHPRLDVVRAPGDGDSAIATLAAELVARPEPVLVVTADRGLRERVHAAGATTVGPGTLWRALGH